MTKMRYWRFDGQLPAGGCYSYTIEQLVGMGIQVWGSNAEPPADAPDDWQPPEDSWVPVKSSWDDTGLPYVTVDYGATANEFRIEKPSSTAEGEE